MKHFLLMLLFLFAGILSAGVPAASATETDQTHSSVLEGRLIKLKQPKGEAVYRIAIVINQKEYDVAYASSSRLRLDLWNGRIVRIEGMRKWLPGLELPCVDVRKITPLWNR